MKRELPLLFAGPGQNAHTFLPLQYGGFKVVGDTPLKLFTVHIVDKGKPLYDYGR